MMLMRRLEEDVDSADVEKEIEKFGKEKTYEGDDGDEQERER